MAYDNPNIDKKALNKWEKASISYENYQDFINKKKNRFKLTFVDLLYISNFKGGYSTINESEKIIQKKLISYTKLLSKIDSHFKVKILSELNENDVQILLTYIDKICQFTNKTNSKRIDGFSVSFLSALMNSYFPNLIPIIDRRILINLKIVEKKDIYANNQIKDIKKHFPELIKLIFKNCKERNLSIRDLDKEMFSRKLLLQNN